LAYFVGLLSNKKPTKPTQSKQEKISSSTKDEVVPEIEEEDITTDVDDFSLELDNEEDSSEPIDIDEAPPSEPITVAEDDHTASGRLASLRDEMSVDDKPKDTRPLGDRMADFFND